MITAMSLTNGTLTVIVNGGTEILTARNDHPKWSEIMGAFKANNSERLLTLLSLKAVIEEYTVGNLSVNSAGVTYRGNPLHTVDVDRVMAFLRDGLPYKPIANYIERKMKNPSARAIRELYSFLEHKNMPLTPSGTFIAYKGVRMDYYSIHGNTKTVVLQGTVDKEGHILNSVGAVIEVERSSVDDDFRNGCSFGLHAGSLQYASGWGPKIVLVEIDPADVVSVPDDCDFQKLRCCKYKVVGEYTGAMPSAYTTEFEKNTPNISDDDNDDIDDIEDADVENSESNCMLVAKWDEKPTDVEHVQVEFPNTITSATGETEPSLNPHECPVCKFDEFACVCKVSEETKVNFNNDLTYQQIVRIMVDQLGFQEPSNPNVKIVDMGLDSLDIVEFVMALEEEFGFEIPDELVEKNQNITLYGLVSLFNDYFNQTDESLNILNTVDGSTPSYVRGMHHGKQDLNNGRNSTYQVGDEDGADSPHHAEYIKGYLYGYNGRK